MSESFRFAARPQYSIGDKSEIRLNAAAIAALTDPGVRLRLVDLRPEVFPREQLTPEALAENRGTRRLFRNRDREMVTLIKEFGSVAHVIDLPTKQCI
jgi:hypothetical protein